MKTRAALALLSVAGLASVANAQFQTQGTVTYTLSSQIFGQGPGTPWSAPVAGGNGDSNVDPGEGVLFKVTIAMSIAPGAATTASGGTLGGALTWNPAIQAGSSGTGTNAGFWGGDLNLTGDAGAATAAGTWSDGTTNFALSVRRRLVIATAGAAIGSVNGNGSGLTDIQPAQFNGDADGINHSNNFVTFQGLWIPTSFTARTVNFALLAGQLGLPSLVAAADSNYDGGYTLPVALTCASAFGAGQAVHVVPGPSSMALLGLGGLVAARRRR
jgi:uncharacterized protein (TIGR03382 family)